MTSMEKYIKKEWFSLGLLDEQEDAFFVLQ